MCLHVNVIDPTPCNQMVRDWGIDFKLRFTLTDLDPCGYLNTCINRAGGLLKDLNKSTKISFRNTYKSIFYLRPCYTVLINCNSNCSIHCCTADDRHLYELYSFTGIFVWTTLNFLLLPWVLLVRMYPNSGVNVSPGELLGLDCSKEWNSVKLLQHVTLQSTLFILVLYGIFCIVSA